MTRNTDAAAFLETRRAQGVSADDALAILDQGPDVPPQPGDELPEGYGQASPDPM